MQPCVNSAERKLDDEKIISHSATPRIQYQINMGERVRGVVAKQGNQLMGCHTARTPAQPPHPSARFNLRSISRSSLAANRYQNMRRLRNKAS